MPVLRSEIEIGVVRILIIFQDRPMFSHINGKLTGDHSLLNHLAEHSSILTNQNRYYCYFMFYPKTGMNSLSVSAQRCRSETEKKYFRGYF